jgi:CP family cyanate transporter-like MFS transporter
VLACCCLVSVAGWLLFYRAARRPGVAIVMRVRVWRRPIAWVLGLAFGLQALVYWGSSAWLPGVFIERGWSLVAAGGLVGLVNVSALAANLVVAARSDRVGHRPIQIVASAISVLASTLLLVLFPELALVWTATLGIGLGAIFPLLFAATVDLSSDGREAGSVAGFMLLIGYSLAALGPFGLGLARDVSGGFGTTIPLLSLVALLLVGSTVMLRVTQRKIGAQVAGGAAAEVGT